MKIRLTSLVALVALVGLGFTMVSFTTVTSNATTTEISTNGDCDKCNDKNCKGDCDKQEHKCTEECKKNGKCTHKAEASKSTETPKKSCCAHKCSGAQKSCEPKKECGKK